MKKIRNMLVALLGSLVLVCSVLLVAACNNGKTLYKVTTECDNTKGSITLTAPKDAEGYEAGEEVTATVTAKEGFEIDAVTVNAAAVTLTEAGTYTFEVEKDTTVKATFKDSQPAPEPLFGAEFVGEWELLGEGEGAITIAAESFTYDGKSYTVTKSGGADFSVSYTFEMDETTYFMLIGGDGCLLQIANFDEEGNELEHLLFKKAGQDLPDVKIPAYAGSYECTDMEDAPALAIAADGTLSIAEEAARILKNDENAGIIYLIWQDTYCTITAEENGSLTLEMAGITCVYTPAAGSQTVTFTEAQKGEWKKFNATTPTAGSATITVNEATVTMDGTESGAVTYSDEYDEENTYYTFKCGTYSYTIFFLAEDTLVLRSGSNFAFYNETGTAPALLFPQDCRGKSWASDGSSFGDIVVDADGHAKLGTNEMTVIAIETEELGGGELASHSSTTVHALCNGNFWRLTIGQRQQIFMENMGDSGVYMTYTVFEAGAILPADVADYQGSWIAYSAESDGTEEAAVVIDAQGKFSYQGTEYDVLAADGGGYTFDVDGTEYTLGLTYLVGEKYYLLFVYYEEEVDYGIYEYFIQKNQAPINAGGIPSTYDGEYTNEDMQMTLTIANGGMKITTAMSLLPEEFAVAGVEANSDGGHIAVAYSFSLGYCDVMFAENTVTIMSAVMQGMMGSAELIFTNGSSQGGGQTQEAKLPGWIAGTWRAVTDESAELLLKANESTFTLDLSAFSMGSMQCTVTELTESGFIFSAGSDMTGLTAEVLLEDNDGFLLVDVNDMAFVYFKDTRIEGDEESAAWTELSIVGSNCDTTWTSEDGSETIIIDADGKMSWKDRGDPAPLKIFAKTDEGTFSIETKVAYAIMEGAYETTCYKFTFEADTITSEVYGLILDDGSFTTTIFTKGNGQSGTSLPAKFAGTWTQINCMEGEEDVLTIAAGDTTVTIALASMDITCTVTAVTDVGFTLSYDGMDISVSLIDDDGKFLLVDLDGMSNIYTSNTTYNGVLAPSEFQSTTWTSEDAGTLTIDALGNITWNKSAEEQGSLKIFCQGSDGSFYALFGSANECYVIIFDEDISIVTIDFDFQEGVGAFYSFTKQA